VHSEHGWDVDDLGGVNRNKQRLRRFYGMGVHRFIALSKAIEAYLVEAVGLPRDRVQRICNGVDTQRFTPAPAPPEGWPYRRGEHFVIGSVGRMQAVKDPLNLVEAFLRLRQLCPAEAARLRLVMLGGGPLLEAARQRLGEAGAAEQAWLPGDRSDVAGLLPQFDVFALTSLAEGISNTVLEAMACGLPVAATAVGGNVELVQDRVTGRLLPPGDSAALALVLKELLEQPERTQGWSRAARQAALEQFSMEGMLAAYARVYDGREQKQ